MCGIAGVWDRAGRLGGGAAARLAGAMAEVLRHRGPDAGAVWAEPEAGLAFGHRRLSIVDLSPMGAQPMASSCGRLVLSYNGEVYNAPELRRELEALGRRFRGHSDTEVIVEGAAQWGIVETVERLIGMFALSFWDRRERRLVLVRDRLGIKPLYWTEARGAFLFGSELKAFREFPGWTPELDRAALAAYLRFAYVPAPHSIYRGVQKLAPGHVLTLGAAGEPEIRAYWSLAEIAAQGQHHRFAGNEAEAAELLDELLGDAVRRRMVADVPLGAFLSGGIDSSTVVALMQKASPRPVRSFSIGFAEAEYDEAPHAAAVARHLGTDHTELTVSPEHAQSVIPRLPEIYDEPFADSSQIPTYLVSEMTRRHVTVALSGDGGDELFAGYVRYFGTRWLRWTLERVPHPARRLGAFALGAVPPALWEGAGRAIPGRWRPRQLPDKAQRFRRILGGTSADFHRRLVSHWDEPERLAPGTAEPLSVIDEPCLATRIPHAIERSQYLDAVTYLPDDILVKLDRASMAVSLEARVPILDHRVVAFSWTLPPAMKTSGGVGKRVLRRVLDRYVPKALIDRPKMGFGVPIDRWLKGPLRDWAEGLLSERRLAADGILDPAPIRERWAAHLAGHANWQYPLWVVLMFQAWKERWLD